MSVRPLVWMYSMADIIQFTLEIDNVAFEVVSFTLEEELSKPFMAHIEVLSRNERINEDGILDQKGQLRLWRNGEIERYINGIVCSFSLADCGFAHRRYKVTLAPELYRLSLRYRSQIFQALDAEEIITIILKEMHVHSYAFLLKGRLIKREYCVQYRESDLDFVKRLAAEEGLGFTFEHKNGSSKVVFFDSKTSLETHKSPIIYNSIAGNVVTEPFIHTFLLQASLSTTSASISDYSFKSPANKLLHEYYISDAKGTAKQYEYIDSPGRFKTSEMGKIVAKNRLEHLRVNARIAEGKSNVMSLEAGIKFSLIEHTDNSMNIDWFVTKVTHFGKQAQAAEEYAGEGGTRYQNHFSVIAKSRKWRSDPIQKNLMPGPQIAKVMGPNKEEIYCDEYGRVKVHFTWDRSEANEKSSCWVRVCQSLAGSKYGSVQLPRVGSEVIVSFLDGDPDQPIITGRAYNALNQFPYSLPEYKTKTVLRTQTYKGKGFNELSFEDQNGKEEIYFHAQKNMVSMIQNDRVSNIVHDEKIVIKNDRLTTIQNDEHLTIQENRYVLVEKNENLTIKGSCLTSVGKDSATVVSGDYQLKSNKGYVLDANKDIHLKGGGKIVLEAASEISLVVGGSFITISASGVDIMGSELNLNSGGSAGSSQAFSGSLPISPSMAPHVDVLHKEAVNAEKSKPSASIAPPELVSRSTFVEEKQPARTSVNKSNSAGEEFNTAELLYSDAIQKTANKYKVIIGLRAPNKLGQLHLKEGHPSKNFHIKAKSSATGPTAGFITEKALYSKVAQNHESIAKHNSNIQDSLSKHGKLVPLILSLAQIRQAIEEDLMIKVDAKSYKAEYHKVSTIFTINDDGMVFDLDGPVKVLTNPPEKGIVKRRTSIVQNLDQPVTADYDLFSIFPHKNNANNMLAQDCAPRFQGKELSAKNEKYKDAVNKITAPKKSQGQMHADKGNIHFFGEVIIDDLNVNVKADGYQGGLLFWHGDETHNPYSPGLDMKGDKPIFFIPNEPARQIFTRAQLEAFYKEINQKGYVAEVSARF